MTVNLLSDYIIVFSLLFNYTATIAASWNLEGWNCQYAAEMSLSW